MSRDPSCAWLPPVRGLLILPLLVAVPAAAEDLLVVKGDTLRGAVVDVSDSGVVFEPVYGTGAITVPWADVERIETEELISLLYGEDGEATGRILGLDEEGRLRLEGKAGREQAIDTAEIFSLFSGRGTTLQRLRSRFRYWRASLDLGGSFTDATTDRLTGTAGARLARSKGPFHWLLEGEARFAQESATGDTNVTENIQIGFTRGEYDVSDRVFGFASLRGTRDTVGDLALRLEPKLGTGFRIFDEPRYKLAADIGGAYVFEDFFGGRENSYWAIAFGADAEAELPYGAIWRGRVEYVPAVTDWSRDYLIRARTELDLPMLEWLSLVWSLEDEYDNTPAPDAQRNRFTTALALRARLH